jgi:phosphoenolpyruvate-protein phosphotransferase
VELALEGVSAAPGVTAGRAVVLDRSRGHVAARLPVAARGAEAKHAIAALQAAAGELERIAAELRSAGRDDDADIVGAGVLMALDPELASRVTTLVVDAGLPAPEALLEAADQTAAELSRLADAMLAQRADDVRSVGRRAAVLAAGETGRTAENGVLIASSLGPADVAELAATAKGIALARGGVTAHAAIVARSLGLPMVVGLGGDLLDIEDGEEVVIDGDRGVVVRRPDARRIAAATAHAEARLLERESALARRLEPARTTDGRLIRVLANASTVAELEEATRQGAEGVGLMRTELLFLEAMAWPTHQQQVEMFRSVLAHLQGRTATVRLFDFGGDKTPPFLQGIRERGIDVMLQAPDALLTHIEAVLEAGRGTELRILVPMVTSAAQMRAVRASIGSRALVGSMIETPEAARNAEAIARESDFMSIGTNDLTQLVLGLDREQSRRAPVLDVRVLTLIENAMRMARNAGIPVDVCGEAASDVSSLPIMVGFGVDELSVAAARVGQVRQWVRELAYAECEKRAATLLQQTGHASRERV